MTATLDALDTPRQIPPPPARRIRPGRGTLIAGVAVLALLVVGYHEAEVSPSTFVHGIHGLIDYAKDAFPPDFHWGLTVHPGLTGVLVTFSMGLMATFFALPFSFALALAGSSTTNPNRPTYQAARMVMGLLRSVPTLVWGLVFITAVGLGPFSGVLALTVHSSGITSKLWAEAMDDMDHGPVEAVQATGAGRFQVLIHAILPTVAPTFVGLILYRLDVNVRDSISLGVIGCGGIGFLIDQSTAEFRFDQVTTFVLLVLVLVVTVDQISTFLRRRLTL